MLFKGGIHQETIVKDQESLLLSFSTFFARLAPWTHPLALEMAHNDPSSPLPEVLWVDGLCEHCSGLLRDTKA